jgi:hypothetical protein
MSNHYVTRTIDSLPMLHRNHRILAHSAWLDNLLGWYHQNLNYPGRDRIYKTLANSLYCKNMEQCIREYENKCQIEFVRRQTTHQDISILFQTIFTYFGRQFKLPCLALGLSLMLNGFNITSKDSQ